MTLGQDGLAVSASESIDELDGLVDRIHDRNREAKIKKLLMEIVVPRGLTSKSRRMDRVRSSPSRAQPFPPTL